MPQYLVIPYPYPHDSFFYWRIKDGLVHADNEQKAVEKKNYGGHLVKVVNLDEAEIFKAEITCNTVVTKVA